MPAPKAQNTSKFVHIVVVDDWGSKGYYLKAKKSAAGTWSHKDLDQTQRLKNGDALELQFPDGSVVAATAEVTPTKDWVYDSGHEYQTPSERLRLKLLKPLNLRGLVFDDFSDFKLLKVRRA